MTPEFVAGIVVYLSSEECKESGAVINVGAGFFSRAAIMTGAGTFVGDRKTPPSPEDIRENWKKINGMEGAGLLSDAGSAVMSFISQ
jgi:hypothetical protein